LHIWVNNNCRDFSIIKAIVYTEEKVIRLGHIIAFCLGWIYIQAYALYIFVSTLWSALRRSKGAIKKNKHD